MNVKRTTKKSHRHLRWLALLLRHEIFIHHDEMTEAPAQNEHVEELVKPEAFEIGPLQPIDDGSRAVE